MGNPRTSDGLHTQASDIGRNKRTGDVMLITNVRHDGGEHKRAGLERQGGRRRHMNSHTIRPVTPIALRGTARRRIS